MKDTRLQLVLDDIDAAILDRNLDHLNKAIEFPACSSYLVLARAAVDCASEVA